MKIDDIDLLFRQIREASGLTEFVVIGSLSALGLEMDGVPERMIWSMEVDAYPERDPQRAFEFSTPFGENSPFHREYGYYFDAVSPYLPTLPDGWQDRLKPLQLPCKVWVKFLDLNDCAISKYARGEPKDREWIRAGLNAGVLSLPTIEYRFRSTRFLDNEETALAKKALAEDAQWLAALRDENLS